MIVVLELWTLGERNWSCFTEVLGELSGRVSYGGSDGRCVELSWYDWLGGRDCCWMVRVWWIPLRFMNPVRLALPIVGDWNTTERYDQHLTPKMEKSCTSNWNHTTTEERSDFIFTREVSRAFAHSFALKIDIFPNVHHISSVSSTGTLQIYKEWLVDPFPKLV